MLFVTAFLATGNGPPSTLPPETRGFPRQALHAQLLGFHHPADGRELRFSSELPKDMMDLIKILESI